MRAKPNIIAQLIYPSIIAVVQVQSSEQILSLSETLLAGGVPAIEITTSTLDAIENAREGRQALGERTIISVGAVLDVETCHAACEMGVKFVVSPVIKPELAAAAHEHDRPNMLDTYTPTEAQAAHEAGSDFGKFSPADSLDPRFIRNLRSPLPHLRSVPTGNVTVKRAVDFLNAGSAALGIGSTLGSSEILTNADWPELTWHVEQFVAAAKVARS